jgi:hypothetical protein
MYARRKIEARLYNHCCFGKAISIIYLVCVPVALLIPYAMLKRRICHLWPAPALEYF